MEEAVKAIILMLLFICQPGNCFIFTMHEAVSSTPSL